MRGRRWAESVWFLPTVFGVAAVVLAELLLLADRNLPVGGTQVWFLDDLGASGSRALLTTVGGSMLGAAATSFSITISVLATTSSTYGPRLVRNFMADRGNQVVLAVLTSSFVYCVVVLRAVRSELDDSSAFVPVLAVNAAVLVAVVDVAVLVSFIHHIVSSVQVTTLQHRVSAELVDVVVRHYPDQDADATTRAVPASVGTARLRAGESGYVQGVDLAQLVRRAGEIDLVVEVVAMPGRHVVAGEPLAWLSREPSEAEAVTLRQSFTTGPARTPHQDVRFAAQQATEIAVRGLASGANDPYTAVGALETMAEGLLTVVTRQCPPPGLLDEHGAIRVVARWPYATEVLHEVLSAVRTYGSEHPVVVGAALDLGGRLLVATEDPAVAEQVRAELGDLVEAYAATGPLEGDLAAARARLATHHGRLGAR